MSVTKGEARKIILAAPQNRYGSIEEAFPNVNPGINPFGSRILMQIRSPKRKSAGGIALVSDTRETELWNTQVAKVIALGPVAFRNRDTLESWPEGAWCKPGMFVRVAKYNGDRFTIDAEDGEKAMFMTVNDLDVLGEVTCDPLSVIAFI